MCVCGTDFEFKVRGKKSQTILNVVSKTICNRSVDMGEGVGR